MDKYLLHINEACSENWDAMTPNDKGKFCNNCNKTVFDFTTATDNDIIQFIEKAKGEEFCGKFEEQQLDRWLEKTSIRTSNPALYKFLLSFLLLTGGQDLFAQEPAKQENLVLKQKMDSLLQAAALKSENPDIKCSANGIQVQGQPRIRMGGIRTLTGNHKPLFVIDGVMMDYFKFEKINPKKIISINVLKSEGAVAIYGPDGVNGVIFIETKYSKKGRKKLFAVQ